MPNDPLPFPINAVPPFYGSRHSSKMRSLRAQFGDGYSQRAGDGINTNIESWDLSWDTLIQSERDVIYNFLEERAGFKAILMAMPGEVTVKKWICESFAASPLAHGLYTLTAKFDRVYDL